MTRDAGAGEECQAHCYRMLASAPSRIAATAERRESLKLAFVAAMQGLPA